MSQVPQKILCFVFFLWMMVSFGPKVSALQITKLKEHALLEFPVNDSACWKYLTPYLKRNSYKIPKEPQTIQEAIVFLKQAIRDKQLIWQKGKILATIQSVIDQHQEGNLHLLFGNNHLIPKHYLFFNELFKEGKDGIRLEGVTHIALEAFSSDVETTQLDSKTFLIFREAWKHREKGDSWFQKPAVRKLFLDALSSGQQLWMDLYLSQDEMWAYQLLFLSNIFLMGTSYSHQTIRNIQETLFLMKRSYPKIQGIAMDMSMKLRAKFHKLRCWLYPLREHFAYEMVRKRVQVTRKKKNVIAYMWGADHIRRNHFPRFLPLEEKSYSVRLFGGRSVGIWERALLALGLPLRMFAILPKNPFGGDLQIFFPAKRSSWLLSKKHHEDFIKSAHFLRGRKKRQQQLSQKQKGYQAYMGLTLDLGKKKWISCLRSVHSSVSIRILIAPEGNMAHVDFLSTLLREEKKCLVQRFQKWKFPSPPDNEPLFFSVALQP